MRARSMIILVLVLVFANAIFAQVPERGWFFGGGVARSSFDGTLTYPLEMEEVDLDGYFGEDGMLFTGFELSTGYKASSGITLMFRYGNQGTIDGLTEESDELNGVAYDLVARHSLKAQSASVMVMLYPSYDHGFHLGAGFGVETIEYTIDARATQVANPQNSVDLSDGFDETIGVWHVSAGYDHPLSEIAFLHVQADYMKATSPFEALGGEIDMSGYAIQAGLRLFFPRY
ncbi:hypothetical protein KDK88_09835 [bacterium]|nr:hypothetical protein [bacterium]